MNGIERIKARIEADARLENDRILADAEAKAAEIAAAYKAQADTEAAELAAKGEKLAAEREERLVSAAQMEARKVQLAAKQAQVEKVYALALEKLCAMPAEQYLDILAELLEKASATGKEEVIFSEKDRDVGKAAIEKANQRSGKQLKLAEETQKISGGFILKDKNVEVNCTFETLVRLQKADTAGTVAKMLFA
ncbi:MAG: hypothetical protein E7443_00810 [Ruminococcaceae bacterium]|nr:hypothetical protein [Oscillospiraceae bacterium]